MKFFGAMFLLFTMGLAWLILQPYTQPYYKQGIHAGSPCYASDSGSLRLWQVAFNRKAIADEGCQRVEAARLAAEIGEREMAKAIVCDHPGAKLALGSEVDCMNYAGNYAEVVTAVATREQYCEKRSRKWYKVLWRKRAYKKCIRES